MSIINNNLQDQYSSQELGIPTELVTQCNPKPEEEDWKVKYENLKAEYDDLRTEYELLQDKCNKMVSTTPVTSRYEESLQDQFSHEDGTMEEEESYSVWHDGDESEVWEESRGRTS